MSNVGPGAPSPGPHGGGHHAPVPHYGHGYGHGAYHPPQQTFESKLKSMGTTATWLAGIHLVSVVLGLLNTVTGGTNRLGPAPPPGARDMMKAMEELTSQLIVVESLRAIPFAAASIWLLFLAKRLKQGDETAVAAARTWTLGAFGVLIASTLVQVFVTIPAVLEFSEKMAQSLPTAGTRGPGFDVSKMMKTIVSSSVILGVVFNTVLLSIWPVVLRVWTGRLLKERADAGGASA